MDLSCHLVFQKYPKTKREEDRVHLEVHRGARVQRNSQNLRQKEEKQSTETGSEKHLPPPLLHHRHLNHLPLHHHHQPHPVSTLLGNNILIQNRPEQKSIVVQNAHRPKLCPLPKA